MNKHVLALLAATALAGVAAPAAAQSWQNINQRQANLDRRIDDGIRRGCLTRPEASRLRSEFQGIVRIESDYRRSGGGLDGRERADLDRRFDRLGAEISRQCRDGDGRPGGGGWQSINQRQENLYQRIEDGVRNRQLTRQEADRLKWEFRQLADLEARYRASGGLSDWEQRDLNQRFSALSDRIRHERHDGQGQGSGRGDWYDDGRWWDIEQRKAVLDRRIDQGIRDRSLTAAEAIRLRIEYMQIVTLERDMRRSGGRLDRNERIELDRRFDALARKIRWERNDWENRR